MNKIPVRHTQYTKDNNPIKLMGHHTGGTDIYPLADTSHHTAEIIRSWHLSKVWFKNGIKYIGWDDIGYHWVFEQDGVVVAGRPEDYHGAHVKKGNVNFESVGIVFSGNFDRPINSINHTPSEKQKESFKQWYAGDLEEYYIFDVQGNKVKVQNKIGNFISRFPHITPDKIEPHRNYSNKTCWGNNLDNFWLADLAQEALNEHKEKNVYSNEDIDACYAILEKQKKKIEEKDTLISLLVKLIRDAFSKIK